MGRFIDSAGGGNCNEPTISSPQIHFVITRNASRAIYLVYTTGLKDQKLTEAIRQVTNWISSACGESRKLSGLVYLEDSSTPPPTELSRNALDLLDQCVERLNIIVATTGWADNATTTRLECRHKELLEQWKPFVERGVSVLRLSAREKSSLHNFHTSGDILNLIARKAENVTDAKRAVWKGKEKKSEDTFMDDPRDTDLVIPSGAVKVGNGTESCTTHLQHVFLPHPTDRTRRIVIVDTPGFDDTHISDSEILRRIAVWLAQSSTRLKTSTRYSANMTLAGVIYLHDISEVRLLGSFRRNLDMFRKLVGQDAIRNVVLATTNWSETSDKDGSRRENQLSERHWKNIIDLGAKLVRFADSKESGWAILNHIINQSDVVSDVEIQEELVEIKKILPETKAGQTLLFTLEELLEAQRAIGAKLPKEERTEMEENDQKIRATLKQINDLTGDRLRAWWKRPFPVSAFRQTRIALFEVFSRVTFGRVALSIPPGPHAPPGLHKQV
ncbi:hypothetical protein DXG01_008513 [Tephrocybe rancida]|nr:hypothetical protein DXG01_008513 [Tephrocybe rancida]